MKSNFYIERKHKSEFYQIIQYITDPVFKPKVKSYTGERIHPDFWKDNQRGKGKMYSGLNDYLESLVLKADSIRLKLKSEGRFTREEFQKEFKPEKRTKDGLYDYFDEWIIHCENSDSESTDKERTKRTIQIYGVLKTILFDYSKSRSSTLTFQSFDKDFYRDFRKYCTEERENQNTKEKGVSKNTYSGYIKVLKQFLGWLSENKNGVSQDFRKYKVKFTKSEDKPFKDFELEWLYDQDIYKYSYVKKVIQSTNKNGKHLNHKYNIRSKLESLERARLVILLLCCTGKRVSDYIKMERTEIDGEIIKFLTRKTEEVCYVPYFDDLYFRPRYIVEEMNKKFGGLPKVSDQKLREAIVELCTMTGFKRFKVNTKTGRKTFATIKLLKGVPKSIIMKSTGHKSEKSFDSYVEIDQFDVIKENRDNATYMKPIQENVQAS
jgi:integrase